MIRVFIVDDEPHARRKMRSLLSEFADVTVVGESANGRDALAVIDNSVDLVFLDIQMPLMNGFDVVISLDVDPMPLVVFATAFDEYAIRAFDANALDYLLKPVDPERLGKTLERARRQLSSGRGDHAEQVRTLIEHVQSGNEWPERMAIKSGGRLEIVLVEDIDWVNADGNYVTVHVGSQDLLTRDTLQNFLKRLDPRRFLRIHRSWVVNITKVKRLNPDGHGEYAIEMNDGPSVTLSRTYRDDFLARFSDRQRF